MAFTPEEQKIIEYGKAQGKSKQDVLNALSKYRITNAPKQKTDIGGDVKEFGTGIKESFLDRREKVQESKQAFKSGEQSGARTFFQTAGQAAGLIGDVIGETVLGAGKAVLPQRAEDKISKGVQSIVEPIVTNEQNPIGQLADRFYALTQKNPKVARDIDAALGLGDLITTFAGAGVASKGATATTKTISEASEQFAKRGSKLLSETVDVAGQSKNKIIEFIAPDIDDATKTILKESPVEKFDEYVKVAQEASTDSRNASTFEVVADKAQDALTQLDQKMSVAGKLKDSVVSNPKIAEKSIILERSGIVKDIRKSLNPTSLEGGDRKLVESIITKLEKVKTVGEADKAIDDIQSIIYKANRNLTLPVGPKVEQQLKGLIGKFNDSVKKSAGTNYTKLNAKFSNIKNARDYLNRVLGEKINGVPIRGGSLVKRFFSPSDAGTKKLFAFIKKELGIDLAQDAVIAKYAAELFGDVRSKSLLETLPRSPSGALEKVIDFAVDKTGVGKGIQEAVRQGSLTKARGMTKQKP